MSTGGKIGALLMIFFVVIVLSGLACVIHVRFIEPAEAETPAPTSPVDFKVETLASDGGLELVLLDIEGDKVLCVRNDPSTTNGSALSCDWGTYYFEFLDQ